MAFYFYFSPDIFNQAISHLRNGNAELAYPTCLEGIKQYPDDANLLCLAGQSLIALKRLDEARRLADQAISLYPNFSPAHEVFADLLLIEGKFEAAISSYQQALKLEPSRTHLNAKINRGSPTGIGEVHFIWIAKFVQPA